MQAVFFIEKNRGVGPRDFLNRKEAYFLIALTVLFLVFRM